MSSRALWIIAALAIAASFYIEPCDGHSCKHPQLDIGVTK